MRIASSRAFASRNTHSDLPKLMRLSAVYPPSRQAPSPSSASATRSRSES
jgi:hypothetical protein